MKKDKNWLSYTHKTSGTFANLKHIAATSNYLGITADIRGEPYLVIGHDKQRYILENDKGQFVKLKYAFDWKPATDKSKLIAASRTQDFPIKNASLVYSDGWELVANEEIVPIEELVNVLENLKWSKLAWEELIQGINDELQGLQDVGQASCPYCSSNRVGAAFGDDQFSQRCDDCGATFNPGNSSSQRWDLHAHEEGERSDEKADPLTCPKCSSHTCELVDRDQHMFHCLSCGKEFQHFVYFNPKSHVVAYEVDKGDNWRHYAPGPDNPKRVVCDSCGKYSWKNHHEFSCTGGKCPNCGHQNDVMAWEGKGGKGYKESSGNPPDWKNQYDYRDAEGKERCSNCGAYQHGYCDMFSDEVEPDYVCDEWITQKKSKVAGFGYDRQGNPLEIGKPYLLKSPKYTVPDLVYIVRNEPNLVEAAIDGDTGNYWPLEISDDEYARMMYEFEPFMSKTAYDYNDSTDSMSGHDTLQPIREDPLNYGENIPGGMLDEVSSPIPTPGGQQGMPLHDEALGLYTPRGSIHEMVNGQTGSKIKVMSDGKGGLMGWTPDEGQDDFNIKWDTQELFRIEQAIQQGLYSPMEGPMNIPIKPEKEIEAPDEEPTTPLTIPEVWPEKAPEEVPPQRTPERPLVPASVQNKESRRNYTQKEQKELVDENPHGKARNISKLDLEGTHYPRQEAEAKLNDYMPFWW